MVRIVGHRGAASLAPENTVQSFEAAMAAGVPMVEFDVRHAGDGELVVIHDSTVDRTTDGTGHVADHTVPELQALDAGNGATVPTLADAFTFFADRDVELCVELKETGISTAAQQLAEQHGMLDQIIFISFHTDALAELGSDVLTGLLGEVGGTYVEEAVTLGCDYAPVGHEDANAAAMERLHDQGMPPILCTPNTADELRAAVTLEPYAVMTDYPYRGLQVKEQVLAPEQVETVQ